MKLPEAFVCRMTAELGAEAPDFFRAMDAPYVRGLRMNVGKPAALPQGALEAVPWAKNAYYLSNDSAAGAQVAHEAGAYYLQEPSAMIPAAALSPREDDLVLDLCAAPGGKSTQLAAMLARGTLVSNEINEKRARILSSNIERMGLTNTAVVSASPADLAARWPDYFDKVLVDAPCSGEGMFRRHQETAEEWQSGSPDGCAQRQAEILSCAARMVRPGGRLLYSTCTFGRVENEDQIARFLASHPDFFAVPFALDGLPPAQNGMLRVFPHQMRGEGHFAALLERGGGDAERCPIFLPPEPDRKERALCEAFLKDEILTPCAPNVSFMGRLVCAPARLPAVDGVKVLRLGLHLGQVKGQTFVPDHALAMALPARRTAPLDAKQALSWLHGETIPVPETFKGWCAPTFEGLQLGWGKASDGCLKNHYPKGLRK